MQKNTTRQRATLRTVASLPASTRARQALDRSLGLEEVYEAILEAARRRTYRAHVAYALALAEEERDAQLAMCSDGRASVDNVHPMANSAGRAAARDASVLPALSDSARDSLLRRGLRALGQKLLAPLQRQRVRQACSS